MKEYIVQAIAQETINSFDAHNAPELIRCKYCKHGDRSRNRKGEEMILCYNGETGIEDGYLHEPDWFCADGKREDE